MVLAIVWIFVAFGMGLYARKQGLTFWSIFLISLFFTPIVGAIVFAVEMNNKQKAASERRLRATLAKAVAKWACTKCGTLNSGAFCSACGAPRPVINPVSEPRQASDEANKAGTGSGETELGSR
jgi:hypothetical protein